MRRSLRIAASAGVMAALALATLSPTAEACHRRRGHRVGCGGGHVVAASPCGGYGYGGWGHGGYGGWGHGGYGGWGYGGYPMAQSNVGWSNPGGYYAANSAGFGYDNAGFVGMPYAGMSSYYGGVGGYDGGFGNNFANGFVQGVGGWAGNQAGRALGVGGFNYGRGYNMGPGFAR